MPRLALPKDVHEVMAYARRFIVDAPDPKAYDATVADLMPILGDALIIGGLAVIRHGYERSTKDIDILYANMDGGILRRLQPHFKIVLNASNGWHHLEHRKTGVRLELIPEGGLTTYGFIPGPYHVGGKDGVISLWGLIWLKLVSGRSRDETDIIEVMRLHLSDMPAVREKLPPELHERFDQLLARAKREIETDPNLNQNIGAPPNWPKQVREAPAPYPEHAVAKTKREAPKRGAPRKRSKQPA